MIIALFRINDHNLVWNSTKEFLQCAIVRFIHQAFTQPAAHFTHSRELCVSSSTKTNINVEKKMKIIIVLPKLCWDKLMTLLGGISLLRAEAAVRKNATDPSKHI